MKRFENVENNCKKAEMNNVEECRVVENLKVAESGLAVHTHTHTHTHTCNLSNKTEKNVKAQTTCVMFIMLELNTIINFKK